MVISASTSRGIEANIEDIRGKFNREAAILEDEGKKAPNDLNKSQLISLLLAIAILSNPDPDDIRMKKVREIINGGRLEIDEEKNNELVKRLIQGLR